MNDISTFWGNWNYPTAIRFGVGRIAELADACRELGMSRPLLVTDPGLAQLPMMRHVLRGCLDAGLVVNGVTPTAVRFAPPITVSDTEIDEAVGRFGAVLAGS